MKMGKASQAKNGNKVGADSNDNYSAISLYLNEINRVPLLTRQEEEDLARRAAKGDPKAKEKLISANLRFVVNVAKKYQNQGLPLDDLISEGNIGLINAIERFDVDKGYHFISYAVWWIRQAILKAICEKSRAIRLPLNRANELVQIEKLRKQMFAEKGEDPDLEKIAYQLGMNPAQVADLVKIGRDMISLESPAYDEKDSGQIGDYIVGDYSQDPETMIVENALKEDIETILTELSDKEREIISHRFGLQGKKPLSLKDIGARFNLTKERIRQIEKKTLGKLRSPSLARNLGAYLEN